MEKDTPITRDLAFRVLNIVDQGLTSGVGQPKPGKMCVEAAVAYALGEDHNDQPTCVDEDLREFKINLNDAYGWNNTKSRARGLRAIAIAQLGSAGRLNWQQFTEDCATIMVARHREQAEQVNKKIIQQVIDESGLLKATTATDVENAGHMLIDFAFGDSEDFIPAEIEPDEESEISNLRSYLASVYPNWPREQVLVEIADVAVAALKKQKIPGTRHLKLLKQKPKKLNKKFLRFDHKKRKKERAN